MRIDDSIFNVLFDAGRGSVPVSSREAKRGEPLGELPLPKRAGYRFDGWFSGDTRVDADTVPEEAEDLRLVARWTKTGEKKKSSMLTRQWVAVIVLAAVIVLLAATLAVVNRIVTIYPVTDSYVDAEGNENNVRYYVKKKSGSYALYDKKGNRMGQNEDGYYIVDSGNQYKVDAENGDCELYAVVDYDADGGESLGVSNRIMMFPQVQQKNVYSIEVANEHGSYKIYRDSKGTVRIEGVPETSLASYDPEKFASLCVSCGYMLTMKKLDNASPEMLKNPDGSVDYSAFGLSDADSPAVYTITRSAYDAAGNCVAMTGEDASYTVKVGDAIVSGAGYYVQLVGRDAIYVVSSAIADTVLQPVEALVTPRIVYPLQLSTYLMVYDFNLSIADLSKPESERIIDNIAAFDYQDLTERENTMKSNIPFISISPLMSGYYLNSDTVSEALGNLYEMEILGCRKLGLTPEALAEYNLDGEVYFLTYMYEISDPDTGETGYIENNILISPKTENGTYYVASMLYDMIVEVDQYYFAFLEWGKDSWYAPGFFQTNIIYLSGMHVEGNGKTYDFNLDNRWSYAYYWNDESAKYTVIGIDKGAIAKSADNKYYFVYLDANGNQKQSLIFFINDLENGYVTPASNGDLYYINEAYIKSILSDKDSADVRTKKLTGIAVDIGSWNVIISCPQYNGSADEHVYTAADGKTVTVTPGLYKYVSVMNTEDPTLLDYTLTYQYETDAGKFKTKEITAVKNFRSFYTSLLSFSIEGEINEKEFKQYMGMSVSEYLAQVTEDDCQAKIFYKSKDAASITNGYCNAHGLPDNTRDCIIRFYQYAPGKSMITVELITEYNPDGTPVTNPNAQQGVFYVLSSYVEKFLNDADRLLGEIEVSSESKN